MLSKNILVSSLVVVIILASSIQAEEDYPNPFSPYVNPNIEINVIYPKDSQLVRTVDSMFLLGYIEKDLLIDNGILYVNQLVFPVHQDGGFLAYIPVTPGNFDIHINYTPEPVVSSEGETFIRGVSIARKTITIQIPEPLSPIPFDSLTIEEEIDRPAGDLYLKTGDRLKVAFQGTPGCEAYFIIPGVADSIPMAETTPRSQPYWGESVFGVGAVPDSLLIKGIYTGFYDIPSDVKADSIELIYSLRYPDSDKILEYLKDSTISKMSILKMHQFNRYADDFCEHSSSYKLSINSDDYPFTVRFIDSVQTLRHGPRKGYFSIFQPEGVEVLVTGSEGDWYIGQPSPFQKVYIHKNSVEKLPDGILPPHSYLAVVREKSDSNSVRYEFPLSGKHPFDIVEIDRRTIKVRLYGVTTDTDWIRYDFNDKLVDFADWYQPEEELYEFTIHLTKDIWGYDTYYEGNTFYLELKRPPYKVKSLENKTIVIDPGHFPDPGSIGPTGYTEAEANIGISLALKKELEKKHVNVIMTRSDNETPVALYERPSIAKIANADLFVSIHNNALPDGVNPFVNHGSSTYYYHTHSIDLAKKIQKELVKELKLGDYGLYHGNLAVNRPTQYPAVLIENAFMIIPEHEALLKTDDFRKKAAKAIRKGIEDFLESYHERNKDR
ncbi:MAG: N-acetylmuramoyl-L-alanine amidase [Calditrichaeota bacterium]|nr:MAG: N-acetylmuramoyl-L-alanine amidase [Calditrichota bacterium]